MHFIRSVLKSNRTCEYVSDPISQVFTFENNNDIPCPRFDNACFVKDMQEGGNSFDGFESGTVKQIKGLP